MFKVKFHYPNAFTINQLNSRAFPLSAQIEQANDIHRLSLFPIQVVSISDLIENFSSEYLLNFDVDHYWFDENENPFAVKSLSDVAEEQKIDFKVIDEERIVFRKSELSNLLQDDFSHYNFELIDSSNEPDFDSVLENYIICKEHDWKTEKFLLSKLKDTSFYLNSHDDCYLYLETYNMNLLNEVFERILQFYIQTILTEKNIVFNLVSKINSNIQSQILSGKKEFTVFQEQTFIDGNNIKIPFSNDFFKFIEKQEYKIAGNLLYDFQANEWKVEN